MQYAGLPCSLFLYDGPIAKSALHGGVAHARLAHLTSGTLSFFITSNVPGNSRRMNSLRRVSKPVVALICRSTNAGRALATVRIEDLRALFAAL
jgi:hypothetical protein